MSLEIAFRLPVRGFPRAVFESDYHYRGGRLRVAGDAVLEAKTREALERGVDGALPDGGAPLAMRLVERDGSPCIEIEVDGQPGLREDRIWAKPTRSAWIHATIALAGSGAGFVASYFYLARAAALHSEWAQKMGIHTAGWHLLLTLTLFPASVWGQRLGIRAVQLVSALFFCIHAGMALANMDLSDRGIAFFNAMSGMLFLASVIYGNRAHRDMDPAAAFASGRL